MKAASLLLVLLAVGVFSVVMGQVPQGTRLHQTSMPSYRHTAEGNKLDFVITGSSVTNLTAQILLVDEFELTSFRNGDPRQTNIIAQAPECDVKVSSSAWNDGPLRIFTPTTNLFVKGVGFLFNQTNHVLIISNDVQTRVAKSLLRTSVLAAPRTNSVAEAGQLIKIFAQTGRFDLTSNVVDYAGSVHMIDPQLDMTCDLLTIRLTTNGAVESILARQNVVLTTTNNGRATGATAFYYVTNGDEMVELETDAAWRNGDEQAWANKFTYNSTRHFLTALGHVRVWWPNAETNSAGQAAKSTAPLAGAKGYRKLFADFSTLQFPPTNGPVQRMFARGNVIIVNQADQSSSTSEQAVYERATDRLELTGNPVWWNDEMEIKADTLSAELAGKTYHARANTHFKMRTNTGATNQMAVASGHSTNQWVFISSDDMEYQTNQAIFFRNVETRVVENGLLQDKLDCAMLTLNLTNNQLESAFARDQVHGETAPDASGLFKTIACDRLNAYRSIATGLMKTIDAYTNVVIEEKGASPGAPVNKLTADTVTAQFSAVTNQIERAVAEQNVVLDQVKAGRNTHATADLAVYTVAGTNGQVKLTGSPLAHTDDYVITESDYMIWEPKLNSFQAFGRYKIVPTKPAGGQKPL
jgi:lipopolysaccharide export system protein LptA